jgi:hypothetical protein
MHARDGSADRPPLVAGLRELREVLLQRPHFVTHFADRFELERLREVA